MFDIPIGSCDGAPGALPGQTLPTRCYRSVFMPEKLLCPALWLLLALAPAALAQPMPPTDRPADSLLARPALQAVVDLQVARDAPVLIQLLDNPDAAVRARAAFALASVQDSSAVPALLALLADSSAAVRADAAFALGQAPGAVPAAALLEALAAEADRTVRRRLVEALGKQGDAASLAALAARARDASVRAEAALAVGRYALRGLHAPEAVAFLLDALHTRNDTLRLHAAYYFGRSRDTAAWQQHADTLRAVLDATALDDPAAMHLVTALGRLNDPADNARLVRWLHEAEDWRTRVNAVRALAGRTDAIGIRAALYDRLVDPSVHVAVAAAEALDDGKSWSTTDTDLVEQWVRYNAYAWRITAPLLRGLARQGQTAFVLDQLDRHRAAPPLDAYRATLPALAHLSHADAFDRLVNAAHHQDTRVAYAALTTLATRWRENREAPVAADAYFAAFADALGRKDLALTYVVAPVLADSLFQRFGGAAVLVAAYDRFSTPQDREQMTTLLAALGEAADPAAERLLRRELTHSDPHIVLAAGQALAGRTGEAPVLPSGPFPAERTIDWAYLRQLGPHPHLVLETDNGAVTLVLDAEQAPLTTQTIARFAREGRFDGVPFHRVVPNFVVQGGDIARGDGFGGPPFRIRSEFTRLAYRRGTLGMASSGKDTEGSQYFVTHSMQPHLDGRYTAFGYVVQGLDVVDTIYEDDRVQTARIIPRTP